jgi:hypothetical protein
MGKMLNWIAVGIALVVGLAIGLGATMLVGVTSMSSTSISKAQLKVGDKAPDFRLPDHTGGYVQLGDYQGEKNVVLAFYPLAWTPV